MLTAQELSSCFWKQERFEHFCKFLVQHWLQKVNFSNILKFLLFRNSAYPPGRVWNKTHNALCCSQFQTFWLHKEGPGDRITLLGSVLLKCHSFKSCKLRSQIFNTIGQVLLHFYVLPYIHFLPLVELECWCGILSLINTDGSLPMLNVPGKVIPRMARPTSQK